MTLQSSVDFLRQIGNMPRLDSFTDAEIETMRAADFDRVYKSACKVIPDMLYREFSTHLGAAYWPDMIQDACVGVIRAVESWQPTEGSSLTTWAYKLAKQEVIKGLRRETKYSDCTINYDYSDVPDTDLETDYNPNDTFGEPTGYGQRNLDYLSEYQLLKQKLTFTEGCMLDMMRDGYTQSDMAEAFDVSQPTMSRAISRLTEKIRQLSE